MFKTYSERNKAKNSLVKVYGIAADQVDLYLDKDAETGKWGFAFKEVLDYSNGKATMVPLTRDQEADAPDTPQDDVDVGFGDKLEEDEKGSQDVILAAMIAAGLPGVHIPSEPLEPLEPAQDALAAAWTEAVEEDTMIEAMIAHDALDAQEAQELEECVASPSPSPFGAFAFSQLTATHSLSDHSDVATVEHKKKKASQEEVSDKVGKIERNRPEQNGVKRPSIGGKCRAIWDDLDNMHSALKRTPTSREIKEVAHVKGWENVTTCIQYYAWRRFMGIKGRI